MRDYIQQLLIRLTDAARPLSRNRHFHTFANPHGRRALRISRHLRSLAQDIAEQAKAGASIRVERKEENGVLVRVLIEFDAIKARRTAFLSPSEYELLLRDDAVRAALKKL